VRLELSEPDERYDHFDVLRGIEHEAAIWGESLGIQFIPLAKIRSIAAESLKS